jgi:hypothetical protein
MGIRTATPKQVSQTRQPPRRNFNPWLDLLTAFPNSTQLTPHLHLSVTAMAVTKYSCYMDPSIENFSPRRPAWITTDCALAYPLAPDSEEQLVVPTRISGKATGKRSTCYQSDNAIKAIENYYHSYPKIYGVFWVLRLLSTWAQKKSAISSVMMTCNSPDGPGSRRIVLTYTSGSSR